MSEDCIPTWISSLYSFWNRVLGVLAMIDSDETDWKVVGVGVGLIIVVVGVINDDSSCLSSPLSFVKSKGDCDGCWRGQSWRNLHHWGSLDKNSCWLMLGNSYHRKNTHLFEFGIFKDLNSKRPGLADTVRRFFTVYKVFFYFYSFFTVFIIPTIFGVFCEFLFTF